MLSSRAFASTLVMLWTALVAVDAFDMRQHLATKTAYANRPDVHRDVSHDQLHPSPEDHCEPQHVFMVVRHGTRNPTKKHVKRFQQLEQFLNGLSIDWARRWKNQFKLVDEGLLAPRGEEELFQLGQRMRTLLPSLFEQEYHPRLYDFRSSQKTRALQSGSSFAIGLFHRRGSLTDDKLQPIAISSETMSQDLHLRFHKACSAYQTQVKKNSTVKETGDHVLLRSKLIDQVTEAVAKRLGVGLGDLDDKLVTTLWNACQMEASVLQRTDLTCSVFSEDDVLKMEFLEDAKDYWIKGHGYEINYSMACPLVDSILHALDAHVNAKEDEDVVTKANFRFAHAETVVPLIARLGLYESAGSFVHKEDIIPTVDHDRFWRSSALAPFAANIAVVLHYCGPKGHDPFVQILHNEQTVRNPMCNGEWLCPYAQFVEALRHAMGPCDFAEMCGVGD